MPVKPQPDIRISIPSTYEGWLESLRKHLENTDGTKDLILHLARHLGITEAGAQVKLSRLVNGHRAATMDVFFIITNWLAKRQQ